MTGGKPRQDATLEMAERFLMVGPTLNESGQYEVQREGGPGSLGGKIFAILGSMRSCGVAILIKGKIEQNTKLMYKDNGGRILQIQFNYEGNDFVLINVYAPNDEIKRVSFFESLNTLCVGNCMIQ